jgi:hypothetical protein
MLRLYTLLVLAHHVLTRLLLTHLPARRRPPLTRDEESERGSVSIEQMIMTVLLVGAAIFAGAAIMDYLRNEAANLGG